MVFFSDIKIGSHRCQLDKGEVISMIVVNLLLAVVGSIGNLTVCLTIGLTHRLHTLSSYCILNLSVADLLVALIVEPCLVVILFWKLHGVCLVKVEYAARLVGNLSCSISILTLAIMSVERCLVIVKPLAYRSVITTTRLRNVLIFSWCFCAITPCLDAFVDEDNKATYVQFSVISMAVLYTVILISYTLVYRAVRQQSYQRKVLGQATNVSHESEKKLAKTVAFVIGLFTLFWLPFALRMILEPAVNYGSNYIWTVTASLANSTSNPLVYFYRSQTFRDALKNICRRCNCRRKDPKVQPACSNPINTS